jgi:hypothetical protein
MSDKIRAKQILERWHSNIKSEDKKSKNMPPLFDAIAYELFAGGIDFETAETTMKEAGKRMYPASDLVRAFYKNRSRGKDQTIQEFTKLWHESLDSAAMKALYDHFDIVGVDYTKVSTVKRTQPQLNPASPGMKTEDELNEEDFWKSTKLVTKDNPWLFGDEEPTDGK